MTDWAQFSEGYAASLNSGTQQGDPDPPKEADVAEKKTWVFRYAFTEVHDYRGVAMTIFGALGESLDTIKSLPEGMGVMLQIADEGDGVDFNTVILPVSVAADIIDSEVSPLEGHHILFVPSNPNATGEKLVTVGTMFLEAMKAKAKKAGITLDAAPWEKGSLYRRIDKDPDWGGQDTVEVSVKIPVATETNMRPVMEDLGIDIHEVLQYLVAAFASGGQLNSQRIPSGQKVIQVMVPPFGAVIRNIPENKKSSPPVFMSGSGVESEDE